MRIPKTWKAVYATKNGAQSKSVARKARRERAWMSDGPRNTLHNLVPAVRFIVQRL